jgi:omega-amidase
MKKELIKLRLLQMDVHAASPEANAAEIVQCLEAAAVAGVDLLCVPEMCLTGFGWKQNKLLGERIDSAINKIKQAVKRFGVGFCGSTYLISKEVSATNAAVLMVPGSVEVEMTWYQKTHLFELMNEPDELVAGNEIVVKQTPWACFGLAVCYDLRFAQLFQVMALRGAKVILLPSAWPLKRCHHWRTLLQARAIENQLFIIGINQSGVDGQWGVGGKNAFAGHSMAVDPFGEVIAELDEMPGILDVTLDMNAVDQSRKAIHTLKDRRMDIYGIG